MSHKQGERIQELERDIRRELEMMGIVGVNFYLNDAENIRVEYRIKKPENNIHCRELKKSLVYRIIANITGIEKISKYEDEQKGVYGIELTFCRGFGHDQSVQHGLLSLAYQEIQNHRKRFGV